MLVLAWRNVFRHRGRTATTLAAIVFGVAGLIVTGGFVEDIFLQLGEALIHSQTGHLQLLPPGYYDEGTRSPERYRVDRPDRLVREIAALPEVADVMSRVAFSGLLSNGRSDWSIVGEGVEPDKEARLGTYVKIIAGRALSDRDLAGVALGQGVAQALKLAPGDHATLIVNSASGMLDTLDLEVVGVFQSFSKDFDAHAIRLPIAAAQALLATRGVNSLVVTLRQTADTDRLAATLRAGVGGEKLDVRTWQQLNDFHEKTVALYERQFGVLQLIILAMVLLSVTNSVNLSISERVGEFGTMRALGNTPARIVSVLLSESAMLGVVGALLGVAVGVVLAWSISAIGIPMPPPPNANLGYMAQVRIVPEVIAQAFCVGAFGSVLAGLLPALRVSRTPVADALRANV